MYLTDRQINVEVSKCLQCKNQPCKQSCPLHLSACDFIKLYKENDCKALIDYLYKINPFSEICGLICPNKFCMKSCVRNHIDKSVNISALQATFAKKYQHLLRTEQVKNNGKKVCVIGGGVAGLTATWFFNKLGYHIDLYEKNTLGGELNLIPDFRLPKEVIQREIGRIIDNSNVRVFYEELKSIDNDYTFVVNATGKQLVNDLNIKGEEHIISYVDYLKNPIRPKKVAVIGGGNVAVDCALVAKSENNQVDILVRRNLYDMRIEEKELVALFNHKINVITNCIPKEVCGNNISTNILGNDVVLKDYDLIIKAIGSSQQTLDIKDMINIPISNTVVETIATTINELRKWI